jgi:hypothetical protein
MPEHATQTICVTALETQGAGAWDWAYTREDCLEIARRDWQAFAEMAVGFAFYQQEVPATLDRDGIQTFLEDEGHIFDQTTIQLSK